MKCMIKTEKIICLGMRIVTYSIVAIIAYLLFCIIVRGLPAISWEFLTAMPRQSGSFRLVFDGEGKNFTVQNAVSEERLGSFAWDLEKGAERTARLFGDRETVERVGSFLEGEPLPWFDRYRPEGRSK